MYIYVVILFIRFPVAENYRRSLELREYPLFLGEYERERLRLRLAFFEEPSFRLCGLLDLCTLERRSNSRPPT